MADKSWMDISDRRLPQYEKGVNEFLEFAFEKIDEGRAVRCPCKKCNNNLFRTRESIYEHLIIHGINKDYKHWFHHGEPLYSSEEESDDEIAYESDENYDDGMHDMVYDFGCANANFAQEFVQMNDDEPVRNSSNVSSEKDDEFIKVNSTAPNK